MTKEEALKFINECAKDSDATYGFFVCAVSREDLESHCEDEVIKAFDKLSKCKKEKILSGIAEELNNTYQDYEFGVDMDDVCSEIDDDVEGAFDAFLED